MTLFTPPKKSRRESRPRHLPPSPSSSFSPDISRKTEDGNPVDDVEAARARNDWRLKYAFDHIFDKYGRDFSDIGDEIDLQTGEIVVDNGHIKKMRGEGDTGEARQPILQSTREDLDEWPGMPSDWERPKSGMLQDASDGSRLSPSGKQNTNSVLHDRPGSFKHGSGANTDESVAEPLFHSTPPYSVTRPVSPPGSGSLWSGPRGNKRKRVGNKKSGEIQVSTPKRRPRYRPVKQYLPSRGLLDGSESDDPLLEDHQPSPAPRSILRSREKSMKSPAHSHKRLRHNTASRPEATVPEPQNQLGSAVATTTGNLDAQDTQSLQVSPVEICKVNTLDPNQNETSLKVTQELTSIASKRPHLTVTPDEAKLVMRLWQVEKKGWKEVISYLPGRDYLRQWGSIHWSKFRNDPPLARPWSHEELVKLDLFKDLDGLSWIAICSEFADRQHAEIEYALLCLWAGNEAWDSSQFPRVSTPVDISR